MATDLVVHGPIAIPFVRQKTGSSKHIDGTQSREVLATIKSLGLAGKQGCYVFALRAAKGFTPWYVGHATKGFAQECMTPHKLAHYNAVLFQGHKGTPVMFLVAPGGAKSKVPFQVCDELETQLIQSGHFKNPKIRNERKKKTQEWTVAGVIRPTRGKKPPIAKKFATMMGL